MIISSVHGAFVCLFMNLINKLISMAMTHFYLTSILKNIIQIKCMLHVNQLGVNV